MENIYSDKPWDIFGATECEMLSAFQALSQDQIETILDVVYRQLPDNALLAEAIYDNCHTDKSEE